MNELLLIKTTHINTSKMTGYRAPSLRCTSCCNNFSLFSVVSQAFSMLCMYWKFGHHPHPLGYICVKFRFFCCLRCWASPQRKITYSITQSLTHPTYLMPWEPKLVLVLRKMHVTDVSKSLECTYKVASVADNRS